MSDKFNFNTILFQFPGLHYRMSYTFRFQEGHCKNLMNLLFLQKGNDKIIAQQKYNRKRIFFKQKFMKLRTCWIIQQKIVNAIFDQTINELTKLIYLVTKLLQQYLQHTVEDMPCIIFYKKIINLEAIDLTKIELDRKKMSFKQKTY